MPPSPMTPPGPVGREAQNQLQKKANENRISVSMFFFCLASSQMLKLRLCNFGNMTLLPCLWVSRLNLAYPVLVHNCSHPTENKKQNNMSMFLLVTQLSQDTYSHNQTHLYMIKPYIRCSPPAPPHRGWLPPPPHPPPDPRSKPDASQDPDPVES